MRYIRTDYSFLPPEINGHQRASTSHSRRPTFSLVWVRSRTNASVEMRGLLDALQSSKRAGVVLALEVSGGSPRDMEVFLTTFIDTSLTRGKDQLTGRYANIAGFFGREPVAPGRIAERQEILNQAVVDEIVDGGLVIERSPPEWLTLGALLKGATAMTVGTAVGLAAVGANQWLLLVSVPMGVVLMGAASGISKGLQNGLPHIIEKYLKIDDN